MRLVGAVSAEFYPFPKSPSILLLPLPGNEERGSREREVYRDAEHEGPDSESWQQLSCMSSAARACSHPSRDQERLQVYPKHG